MPRASTAMPLLRERRVRDTTAGLADLLDAQRADVQARHDSGAGTLLSKAWDARLADVVFELNNATASEVALRVATMLDGKDHGFDPKVMEAWLIKNAAIAAENRNATTRAALADAKSREDIDDPVGHVFGVLLTAGAALMAASMVTRAISFGGRDAARSVGAGLKTWDTGGNPRSAHALLNGETVPIDDLFSNGGAYPGDPSLDADESAGCNCSMSLVS